jgi:hypothetical protein
MLFAGNDKVQDMVSSRPTAHSITEVEQLSEGEGDLTSPLAPSQVKLLCDTFNITPTHMQVVVGRSQMKAIVGAVRNRVLDWALKLGEAGILGDGVSFTQKERAVAKQGGDTYNIGNFSGVIGDVGDHAKIKTAQTVSYSADDLRRIVEQVKEYVDGLGLTPDGRAELDAAVVLIESEISKPSPDKGKLRRAFEAVKRIGEGAAGRLVAEGVVGLINQIPWDRIQL